jgi:hypothetical protein
MKTITLAEWKAEGKKLFGNEIKDWKFKCVNCGETQTLREFEVAEIPDASSKFYFSCIGRYLQGRGCDWSLGGLLQKHETEVVGEYGKPVPVYEFAKEG